METWKFEEWVWKIYSFLLAYSTTLTICPVWAIQTHSPNQLSSTWWSKPWISSQSHLVVALSLTQCPGTCTIFVVFHRFRRKLPLIPDGSVLWNIVNYTSIAAFKTFQFLYSLTSSDSIFQIVDESVVFRHLPNQCGEGEKAENQRPKNIDGVNILLEIVGFVVNVNAC